MFSQGGVSKLNQCGLKAQLPHSPGQRPGCWVYMLNSARCKGNSLIIRLLPLQGVGLVWRIFNQGVALGYVLLALRGVLLVSVDTPPPLKAAKIRF